MPIQRRNWRGGRRGRDGNEEETPMEAPFNPKYFVVRQEKGSFTDLLVSFVWWKKAKEVFFEETSPEWMREKLDKWGHRCVILISILVRKIIDLVKKPMEFFGFTVDYFLNLLFQNGGFFRLCINFITGRMVVPEKGSKTFIGAVGQLDRRMDLRRYGNNSHINTTGDGNGIDFKSNAVMDLCIMASKLAYENENVVRSVITDQWTMHFEEFYNCWDDIQVSKSTQVFILSDKSKDADFILVSFRGTQPFDANDWITDWDYSWYEIPTVGKVHMGFLEALGIVNRDDPNSFSNREEKTAYHTLRRKLETLLDEHPRAVFLVTGHSLGGALAILFPTLLVYHGEWKLMSRLSGIYTFGQPRIGDEDVGKFMEKHVRDKYRRVVYCNDAVPRLPYDDKIFFFKHFGCCLYFDSMYREKVTEEVPNRNYLTIRYLLWAHLNAIWELVRCFLMVRWYGSEYKEGILSVMARFFGLIMPGVSAHAARDYINCVRLGDTGRRGYSSNGTVRNSDLQYYVVT